MPRLLATRLAPALAVLTIVASGCGAPPSLYGEGNVRLPGGGGVVGAPDMARPAPPSYPTGTVGNQVGEVIPNLSLTGYRLTPETTDFEALQIVKDITFGEYHTNPACKVFLVTMGASWCTACQQEQPYLTREVSGDPAFCVINILQEGHNQERDATQADLDEWVGKYNQSFNVVLGNKSTRNLWQGYGPVINLPFNLIIKPQTMEVLETVEGFDTGIYRKAMKLAGN